jgi:hypothetical protein
MNQQTYAAYIGIDWSDRKHDIYLYDCTTGEAEESVISSQPEAIQELLSNLVYEEELSSVLVSS